MFSNSFALHFVASLIYIFFNFLIKPTYDFENFKVTFFLVCYFNLILVILRMIFIYPILRLLKLFSKNISKFYLKSSDFIILTIIFFDNFLYSNQGLHVYDKVVLMTISNPNFNKELGISTVSIISFGMICLLLYLLKAGISKFFLKTNFLKPRNAYSSLAICLIVTSYSSFFFLPSSEAHSNAFPFYTALRESPGQNPLKLTFDASEAINTDYSFEKKNIVVLVAESLRADYFNSELAPLTTKLLEDKGCQNLQAYSGGHTTEYGIFSILNGQYSFHFDDFKKNNFSPFIINYLNSKDYSTFGVSASKLSSWNESKFMLNSFLEYKEISSSDVAEDDQKVSAFIIDRIHSSLKPFFVFAFFNSTHHNYFYPERFETHTPVAEKDFDFLANLENNKDQQIRISNRYKNSISYLDSILFKTVNNLFELDSRVILFITGDHGEEFWEEGAHGHGKTSYINPRVKVPLWACGISKSKRTTFNHHSDIMPTIMHELGLSELSTKYFGGYPITNEEFSIRPPAILNGPQFPYRRNKAGIITTNYKFWVKKSTKRLFDFYKYRTTNHQDQNILDGSDTEEYQNALNFFKENGYKFLKE